jgi:2-polyprenyl-3-methyl-5-hydroxy-6-metoxy-1,4-benzoquinol methylase
MDRLFRKHLASKGDVQQRLLEVGCGNSIWLSYFNRRFGYKVSGIDYSEFGCEQTRKILSRDGCSGDIRYGDLFAPPEDMTGKFDVVCSFGVVEHFEDTSAVLTAISRFLKPGGILITTVPNLNGPTGFLQKKFNKPVYDIHVIHSIETLTAHLKKSGLEPLAAEYFSSLTFGVNLVPAEGGEIAFRSDFS